MISLPLSYYKELIRFHLFVRDCLTPHQDRVLELLSLQGLSHKEVALAIDRSPKTVERITTLVVKQYCRFYNLPEREVSFKKVQSRATCYYYLKSLL